MIKGINKQIIEIKCPKNEQYERILLFQKPNGDLEKFSEIDDEMFEVYKSVMNQSRKESREHNQAIGCIVMLTLTCLFLAGFLIYTII